MQCLNCNIEFEPKRKDAKYCSPNCKLQAFRKQSIETDNVTLSKPIETDKFKFTIKRNKQDDQPNPVREALYWYDVPIAAVPVKQKDWPAMPEFMNGRQYFLWWKNNFELNTDLEKGELGLPIIHNPFPVRDSIRYEMGGEGSRKWGA